MIDTHQVWLKQSGFDLEAARLSYDYGFYEWACFQAEQAAEKAFKSYLVFLGEKAPHVHELTALKKMCDHKSRAFRQHHWEMINLEAVTFVARYPFAIPQEVITPREFIQREEALLCLKEANAILERITSLIHSQ